MRRADPKCSVLCKLDGGIFQRLFVSLGACTEGFKFCRPIIGIDGCFLKGKYGGQLLAAIGMDANDCIFPIAFAIVEVESTESWTWSVTLLKEQLQMENPYSWTWMSDKQKGLIAALESMFPESEHRFCLRHMHNNMKKAGHTSRGLKNLVWAVARATTVPEYSAQMEEIKKNFDEAYKWLIDKPPQQWSRSHFSTIPKCDILLNNLCESFNR